MLGAGGGSGATSPSRRVQRDWMASILSGGASWMPAMAAVSFVWSVNDSVGGSYFWDQEDMMFDPERVSDPLAACVSHENPNALIVISGM
jgi:hypothetical protein